MFTWPLNGIVGRYLAVNTRRWNIYFRQAIYARTYPMAGVVIVPDGSPVSDGIGACANMSVSAGKNVLLDNYFVTLTNCNMYNMIINNKMYQTVV